MAQIQIERDAGGIEGLCVITPAVHGDDRGTFVETYNRRDMEEAGLHYAFVQDNQSSSVKGVLRGLHFQKRYPQAKLVRVIRGAVYDAAVDLRKGSATFGRYFGILLTEENRKQILIPKGFAHGFLVLSDRAEFCYKCDDFYHADDEGGVAWNDPDIGIDWPELTGAYPGDASPEGYRVDGAPLILSGKDRGLPVLRDAFIP
jgi:dTDP-4-dehydrorhamnose 3,5-epimerase